MPATPFKVKAVYEYKSAEPDDLNFPNGQIITVTEEEDDDWYSGEYINAAGEKVHGIFPRNFVEKYEPAIPSRPTRTPKRPIQPEAPEPEQPSAPGLPAAISEAPPTEFVQNTSEEPLAPVPEPIAEPQQKSPPAQVLGQVSSSTPKSPPTQVQSQVSSSTPKSPPAKPTSSKPPPPVAEKPSGNSFKDRIAAFNKSQATPVAPFKPGASTGFIKKPFVAPPPSKNAYVPPPREQPPPKVYRREEELAHPREHAPEVDQAETAPITTEPAIEADQPKPISLKERVALLQKQQLEQAARHAESSQKKERSKRPPPKKRAESSEELGHAVDPIEPQLERVDTNETVGKKSVDFADDEAGPLRGPRRQPSGHAAIRTPPPPSRELMSDTNDADDSGAGDTEDALETSTEEDRRERRKAQPVAESRPKEDEPSTGDNEEHEEAQEPEGEEEEEEEEDDEDPEIRRRREIRDRMAKMSGGMGMMGMFGPPGGLPGAAPARKPKPQVNGDKQASYQHEQDDAMTRAPPVPLMALPGMSNMKSPRTETAPEPESDEEDTAQHTPQESEPKEDEEEEAPLPPKRTSIDRAAPPVPQDRAVPAPPSRDTRAVPPLPPPERSVPPLPSPSQARAVPLPPPITTRPLALDDDMNEAASSPRAAPAARPQSKDGSAPVSGAPPVPISRPSTDSYRTTSPPTSPITGEKRTNRAPPPLPPMSPIAASGQSRAPPPPPPGQPPTRRSTSNSHHSMASSKHQVDNDSEDEVTEYDGDYDTDIASSAKHKDALKSHNRDSSLDDGPLGDESVPSSPPARAVPPLPTSFSPRDLPPPLPQSVPKSKKSMDAPRAAPPPVPPPKEALNEMHDDYDPYRYQAPQMAAPSPGIRQGYNPMLQSPKEELDEDDMYDATPHATRVPAAPPAERGILMPATYTPAAMSTPEPTRESFEPKRSLTMARRSMEQNRPSGEQGYIASDIDLGQQSMWWAQDKMPPPALQNRNDVRFEIESSTTTTRGGKVSISKEVYVLYMDYSQSTIHATFDPQEPSHATLEQRHERPPPPPRQDQLEDAATQFSSRIAEAAAAKSHLHTAVGDGSAVAFVQELMQPLRDALLPIGTRAYGALVYANLANASTQQYDQIRAGDIVTFRNAKFSGHKGGLKQKYSMEVGKPDHAAVVIDWDGTKKKIRAWEQGREADGKGGKKSKVKEESFRVEDLKSGEVRVWRVMGRKWVGWAK